MPKTILAENNYPDIRKAWLIYISVDENILDRIINYGSKEKSNYPILRIVSKPGDDFSVDNRDIPKLRAEIHDFITGKNIIKIQDELYIFLYTLDGICSACEISGKNLYGFTD